MSWRQNAWSIVRWWTARKGSCRDAHFKQFTSWGKACCVKDFLSYNRFFAIWRSRKNDKLELCMSFFVKKHKVMEVQSPFFKRPLGFYLLTKMLNRLLWSFLIGKIIIHNLVSGTWLVYQAWLEPSKYCRRCEWWRQLGSNSSFEEPRLYKTASHGPFFKAAQQMWFPQIPFWMIHAADAAVAAAKDFLFQKTSETQWKTMWKRLKTYLVPSDSAVTNVSALEMQEGCRRNWTCECLGVIWQGPSYFRITWFCFFPDFCGDRRSFCNYHFLFLLRLLKPIQDNIVHVCCCMTCSHLFSQRSCPLVVLSWVSRRSEEPIQSWPLCMQRTAWFLGRKRVPSSEAKECYAAFGASLVPIKSCQSFFVCCHCANTHPRMRAWAKGWFEECQTVGRPCCGRPLFCHFPPSSTFAGRFFGFRSPQEWNRTPRNRSDEPHHSLES